MGSDIKDIKIVQVNADGRVLDRECIVKSVITCNAGSDLRLQLFNSKSSSSGEVNKKIDLQIDASEQGHIKQVPLWDLRFDTGLYADIDNGTAFIIYELGINLKGSDVVQLTGGSSEHLEQAIVNKKMDVRDTARYVDGVVCAGVLKGIIIQGGGSDTQVRLWDADWSVNRTDRSLGSARLLDLKIDASVFNGFCEPIDLENYEIQNGIFVGITNGSVFLVYQQ